MSSPAGAEAVAFVQPERVMFPAKVRVWAEADEGAKAEAKAERVRSEAIVMIPWVKSRLDVDACRGGDCGTRCAGVPVSKRKRFHRGHFLSRSPANRGEQRA